MDRRTIIATVLLLAALAIAAVWRLLVGGAELGLPDSSIVWELRGIRLAAGVCVGACLAVAGVLLQSLLRNPLASPDLMGLAAGAGFAVMLASYLAQQGGGGATGAVSWAAFGPAALVGSLGALVLVYVLSQRSWLIDPISMVLVGVIVSVVFGAAAVFVQHLMPDRGEQARRWLMGLLSDELRWRDIAVLGAITVCGVGASVWLGRAMDAATLGEDEARSVGVPLGKLRAAQFVLAGLLTAVTVVVAGPIGFVGLVCPHAARLLGGPGHRWLVVGAGIAGAALVVGSDALVKSTNVGGGRLPIGVVTAVIGGPVFVVLLRGMRG